MNYKECMDFLYERLPVFQRVGKAALKTDLTNTWALVKSLGNPQNNFKSLHVAGTNGKGSTAHMLASVLQESGFKVGLYTSPHLKRFGERIRVNGKEINEGFVTSFVNQHKSLIQTVEPSFFEVTVAMAFDYFSACKVDIGVVEVGLGGRLDSTNIIHPELSFITSISKDHEDVLGKGIENIAREKSGIIKEKTPILIGALSSEARHIVSNKAQENNAPFIDVSSRFRAKAKLDGTLDIEDCHTEKKRYTFNSELGGNSLKQNVPLVVSGVQELVRLGYAISSKNVIDGINRVVSNTGLKGRWQVLKNGPMVVADIGHNVEAVKELMNRIESSHKKGGELHMVWGMANDKSTEEIFSLLIRNARYYFCAAQIPRAMDIKRLEQLGDRFDLAYSSYSSVDQAYQSALTNAGKNDFLFIGGSTFVVAEINDI